MAAPDPDPLYEVAYDEAVRALVEQQAAIDSLRNRAGLLLSAAAITTSFLGSRSLGRGDLELAGWLATASFVGVALISLIILWPRRWEFEVDPAGIVEVYIEAEEPASVGQVHRDLALHLRRSCLENSKGLSRIASYFQFAVALLTTEVTLWVVALASPL